MRTVLFDGTRWSVDSEGTWLSLRVPDRESALEACENIQAGKRYVAEIKQHRVKRSLEANAYAWQLIGKLAVRYGLSPDEVYRQQIRQIGGVYTIIAVPTDMVAQVSAGWCAGHIGRMADDMGPCRTVKGRNNLRLWIGSSDYDTKQMSQLIDAIVQECKAAGIETLPPEEIARLESEWGKQKTKD